MKMGRFSVQLESCFIVSPVYYTNSGGDSAIFLVVALKTQATNAAFQMCILPST